MRPYEYFGTVTDPNPTVAVTGGAIRGRTKDGVAIFAGIPYGGDVSGEHRFLPPTPVEPWEGTLDCTKPGKAAIQGLQGPGGNPILDYVTGGRAEEIGIFDETSGENCLVLNVLTPGLDGKKRPVLFYIHGGGYANGSGLLALGGDKWCREEDIVLVSVNHRLNVFGYLYLGGFDPKYADSGCAGLLDLVQALEWVRQNIAAFGGDPENVAIFGESGGGSKVSHLCAMEQSKGLFRKAIVMSGSAMPGELSVDPHDIPLEEAHATACDLLKALGVSPEDISPLLTQPARRIYDAAIELRADRVKGGNFCPVIDNRTVFPNPVPGQFTALPNTRNIPMIIGSTQDETAMYSRPDCYHLTWETLPEKVMDRCDLDRETADRVIAVYRQAEPENTAPVTYFRIASDCGFTRYAVSQIEARMKPGIAKTWRYQFTWDVPACTPVGPIMASHTTDLPLEFRLAYYPESEELSRSLAHAWAQFARTGDPSDAWLKWPAYEPEHKYCMIFDLEPHLASDPDGMVRPLFDTIASYLM